MGEGVYLQLWTVFWFSTMISFPLAIAELFYLSLRNGHRFSLRTLLLVLPQLEQLESNSGYSEIFLRRKVA